MSQELDFAELIDRDGLRRLHPSYDVSDRTFGRYEAEGLDYIEMAGKHWYQMRKARAFALSRERRRNPQRRAA